MCLEFEFESVGDGGSSNNERAAQPAREDLHVVWAMYTGLAVRLGLSTTLSNTRP